MHVDHIGWITDDIDKFERFWVGILKYKFVQETQMALPMAYNLFGIWSEATIRRYRKVDAGPDIEIHCFKEGSHAESRYQNFDQFGINHICVHTGGPGSRQEFIELLPSDVKVHIFDNPKGWQNIFIRDYEGNWVELRENLKPQPEITPAPAYTSPY